ncbi:ribosome small subunit-dependent GTPase A [uncultured Eubacterium sp.]|uniref:ribosome small subunit-dependent GTPase A n=1 Tax=uncultured Eubacterium sp. TaxID=165185 RepID=UPI0015AB291B|nr:ribosome small subunit-dependent GTPase A [uncultured Eubacterium sp.]
MIKGKIVKGIGGFYYVDCDNEIIECKARGSFRKQGMTPLVGDDVEISVFDNSENAIETILPRKNELIRPPLANLDTLFIVASIVDPKINTLILDNLIAVAEYKHIEPIIVFTKIDLDASARDYKNIYDKAGFKTILCDNTNGLGADEIRAMLNGKCSAFTGNTGVGKSSLLNNIFPELNLATGETSKKLGRGKHTTRHCELFKVDGGYIADTPGFSSLDFQRCEKIMKDDLPYCFREFDEYLPYCKFSTCTHTCDKGCAVVEAVEQGKISTSRHNSYVSMYNEVKDVKQWEMR